MKPCLPAQSNQNQCWKGSIASPSSLVGNPARSGSSISDQTETQHSSGRLERILSSCLFRRIWLWFCLVFFSVLSYFLCNQFIFTPVIVQGKSMLPTLQEGEYYLLNRLTYWRQNPQRGDLVVIKDPGHSDFAVKRIVAMPGETIFLSEGNVYVNNNLLYEPYVKVGAKTFLPDAKEKLYVLGQNEYFVMGDNRMVSEDSRYYGPISRRQIAGHLSFN